MQFTLLCHLLQSSVTGACDIIPVRRWPEQAAAVWYKGLEGCST